MTNGDLISRTALLELLTLMAEYQTEDARNNTLVVCEIIKAAHAVDAEPVRRGEWVATGEFDEWYAEEHKCSICGGIALGNQDAFCLSCGAKMDAEGDT